METPLPIKFGLLHSNWVVFSMSTRRVPPCGIPILVGVNFLKAQEL